VGQVNDGLLPGGEQLRASWTKMSPCKWEDWELVVLWLVAELSFLPEALSSRSFSSTNTYAVLAISVSTCHQHQGLHQDPDNIPVCTKLLTTSRFAPSS
jgi:hypothetical protein